MMNHDSVRGRALFFLFFSYVITPFLNLLYALFPIAFPILSASYSMVLSRVSFWRLKSKPHFFTVSSMTAFLGYFSAVIAS